MQYSTCIGVFHKFGAEILSFAKFQELLIGILPDYYHIWNILICSFISIPIFNKLFSDRKIFRSLSLYHKTQLVYFDLGKICRGSAVYAAIFKTIMYEAFVLTMATY